MTIHGSTITGNGRDGVLLYRASDWCEGQISNVTIHYSNIYNNTQFGVQVVLPYEDVDATNNWWGANNGPSHSPGSGDKVPGNVTYTPYLMLTVSASPTSITADGTSTSTITAQITDSTGVVPSDIGNLPSMEIHFATDKGTLTNTIVNTDATGKATTTLKSSTISDTATVTAAAPPYGAAATATTAVVFGAGSPTGITLSPSPSSLIADGKAKSTVTATVKDAKGNLVKDGTKVSFTTTLGSITSSATTSGGKAKATLTSSATSGTATVTAKSDSKSGTAKVGMVGFTSTATPDADTIYKNGETINVDVTMTGKVDSVTANFSNIDSNGPTAKTGSLTGGTTYRVSYTLSSTNTKADDTYVIPVKATLHGASISKSTFMATLDNSGKAGGVKNEGVSKGETSHKVVGPSGSDTTVTVSANEDVTISIVTYNNNPHPEADLPANTLLKYIDITYSNLDAVNWPVRVEMSYTDEELEASGVVEENLGLYYFKDNAWHRCSSTGVKAAENIIWANMLKDESTGSPLIPAASVSDLNNLLVYPNPFKPNDGNVDTGCWCSGITFGNLTSDAKISIYTLNGELVKEMNNPGMSWNWNVCNKGGERLASGIYLYLVTNSSGEKKTGKIVIVR